jgi:hypothetical protein
MAFDTQVQPQVAWWCGRLHASCGVCGSLVTVRL